MNRCWHTGLVRVARDRSAQDVELVWSASLEIEEKTGLGARWERVDSADDLRAFVGGKRNSAGARNIDYFLHGALEQAATEWLLAQRPDGGA